LDNELKHVGILGMHWGQRNGSDNGVSRSTNNLAKKDAKRYMDAKMFYGKTAGTRRKLLKAELDKKIKNVPGYEQVFNQHLEGVDKAKSAQKAVSERNRIDTTQKGRSLLKKMLGVTGSLTVGIASMAYAANKEKVDSFVIGQSKRLVKDAIYGYKRFKVSSFH
jgi:hypothetical protein